MARKAIAEQSTRHADRSAPGTESRPEPTLVWIAGRIDGDRWQLLGIYATELEACAACRDADDWVVGVPLGVPIDAELTRLPHAYRPFVQDFGHRFSTEAAQRETGRGYYMPTPAEAAARAMSARADRTDEIGIYLRCEQATERASFGDLISIDAIIHASQWVDSSTLTQILRAGAEKRTTLIEAGRRKNPNSAI